MRPAAGIEPSSPQGRQRWGRELRRRPWEPPQSRWPHRCWTRTTGESPAAAPKKQLETEGKSFKIKLNLGGKWQKKGGWKPSRL